MKTQSKCEMAEAENREKPQGRHGGPEEGDSREAGMAQDEKPCGGSYLLDKAQGVQRREDKKKRLANA